MELSGRVSPEAGPWPAEWIPATRSRIPRPPAATKGTPFDEAEPMRAAVGGRYGDTCAARSSIHASIRS
jgi:hypothetical protein